ncbi:MAG TPA: hypothetical protein VFK39_16385, partial [Gemmatimonadaceae bacterium]|nr:hypothetical protein [Gemmatimonadaceae bacterium]
MQLRSTRPFLAAAVLLLAAALLAGGAPAGAQQGANTNPKSLLLDPSNPEWKRPSPPVWYARFETSKGNFVVKCERAHAPNGSDR